MDFTLTILISLALLSLLASTVNGGLGYGYSSISTPLAILVIVNRVTNPVYVLVEACMNTVIFVASGASNVKSTFKRVLPIIAALIPGIVIGTYVLTSVAPVWVRFLTYVMILPLILLQAGGLRRPIKSERAAGVPLGLGTGLLYSITTISGPPIVLFFNNQGLVKGEFKAAISQIRIAESFVTVATYSALGLFTATTYQLFAYVAPPILIGIPLGIIIVKRIGADVFRRVCMSFDAWIVGYGLAVVMGTLFGLVQFGYAIWAAVVGIDLWLLYRFFTGKKLLLGPRNRPAPPLARGN